MDVMANSYMPGDPRLVQQLVYELKSQGIFDEFRKECIADVDTKPAYQNLRQRVEGSVTTFLKQQNWSPDLNKNQLREQLRKNIYESGYLEMGVERIVDQVVNPKINSVFLPQVEDVVYKYLGVEKPTRDIKKDTKPTITDLLPTDLEAVSPESVHSYRDDIKKDDGENMIDSVNSKPDEDESPPFEPLENIQDNPTVSVQQEENSIDSQLSGFSGLQSHESNQDSDQKVPMDIQMDWSNQDSQISQNSSDSRLSVVTSEETRMEIFEDSESKMLKLKNIDNKQDTEIEMEVSIDVQESESSRENMIIEVEMKLEDNDSQVEIEIEAKLKDENLIEDEITENNIKKIEEKSVEENQPEEKKSKDKKSEERKNDDKKSKGSDKHSHKDKKDGKYKKDDKHKSSNKDKEKGSSRYSSSSSKEKDNCRDKESSIISSDKEKIKDGKDTKSNYKEKCDKDKEKYDKEKKIDKLGEKSRDKYKDKYKSEEKSNKDKDKMEKSKDKSRNDKEKSEKIKEKYNKENSVKEKGKPEKEKDKYVKDKEKYERDKDKSEKHKDKSEKDKRKSSDKLERNKERIEKDKPELVKIKSEKDKEKNEKDKDRSDKNKEKSEKDKDRKDKDKNRSSSSNKHSSRDNEKDRSRSSLKRDSSSSSSSKKKHKSNVSNSNDRAESELESKSTSGDKPKKDKHQHNDKYSSSSSSSKKTKEKKRDSKKDTKDDHYSFKDKKTDRRSFDRDSNDGRSAKQTHSFTENSSSYSQQNNQDSSYTFSSGSGSGDTGTSDPADQITTKEPVKLSDSMENQEITIPNTDIQKFKYTKPKFASNLQEARKLMKIRKQLAMLERQNKLGLTQIETNRPFVNGLSEEEETNKITVENHNSRKDIHVCKTENVETKRDVTNSDKENADKQIDKTKNMDKKTGTSKNLSPLQIIDESSDKKIGISIPIQQESIPDIKQDEEEGMSSDDLIRVPLQTTNLSKENWEALEARLAQEMSNINYNSYESHYDDYDDVGYSHIVISPRKVLKNCNKIITVLPQENEDAVIKETNLAVPENKNKEVAEKKNLESDDKKDNRMNIEKEDKECFHKNETDEVTENCQIDKGYAKEMLKNKFEVHKIQDDPVKMQLCVKLEEMHNQKSEKNMTCHTKNIDQQKVTLEMEGTTNVNHKQIELVKDNKSATKTADILQNNDENNEAVAQNGDQDECRYLEKPHLKLQQRLHFLHKIVEKLEIDLEHSIKTSQNNFLPAVKGRKRKLVENVDLTNNNKSHFERITVVPRRSRVKGATPRISKASKDKMCNNTDISTNHNFSLPLSPAESDKSVDKKEEEVVKLPKQKKILQKTSTPRLQRYSSEELYKPRPTLGMGTRRSRGAKNI